MRKPLGVIYSNLGRALHIGVLSCSLACFAGAQKAPSDHTSHQHGQSAPERASDPRTRPLVVPDVDVLTQDGKPVKFYTDLLKGKTVFITFIFTSCRQTCPFVGRNLQKLQEELGNRLGKDVSLVTVSTDPVVDTPGVIKKWSDQFNRREGWTVVTGEEAKINNLLQKMTGFTRQTEGQHTSLLIMYDGVSGAWTTTSSVIIPAALLDDLDKFRKKAAKSPASPVRPSK